MSWKALVALLSCAIATTGNARGQEPTIAVFSGPTATIQNSEPLITSNKARSKYGLPPLTGPGGKPLRFDALRAQRLAAPVTVYVEAFSAHPLEQDVSELYAAPDGYVDRRTRAFSPRRQSPDDLPVYAVTLAPEDGPYLLPYMARQTDGSAWEGDCAAPGAAPDRCRVPFYPDAHRIFEEIDRFGIGANGATNLLGSKAAYHFYRPAPSGGYRKGLPASLRTDVGDGDIPQEVWGRDFFTYRPIRQDVPLQTLALATNQVQRALATGRYAGGIWLEGSPNTEETIYWLNLLIDTTVPIVGNSSQRTHTMLSNDGDRNIVDAVDYILSGLWKDAAGRDQVGAVMIQEERVITAREVQKGDDRPGGYIETGGHGGLVGGVNPLVLTFIPARRHTHASAVNLTSLPDRVTGVTRAGTASVVTTVRVKDADGGLVPEAMPNVTLAKYARYATGGSDDAADEVELQARIGRNLDESPLSGFVLEGIAPYGLTHEAMEKALELAALHGMPVVRVGRGNHDGFTPTNPNNLSIEGSNLTATKARLLLMACLLKLGSLPPAADPARPSAAELQAIRAKIAEYQAVFDTH